MTELQTDTQCPANTPKGLTVWVFVLTVVAFIVVVGYSIALYRLAKRNHFEQPRTKVIGSAPPERLPTLALFESDLI